MTVDIFLLTSIKSPKKQGGRYAYLLRYMTTDGKEVTYWDEGHSIEEATQYSAELTALIEALKHLKTSCELKIYTDCGYIVCGLKNWVKQWVDNMWITSRGEPVANAELWQEVLELTAIHEVEFKLKQKHEFYKVMQQAVKEN